MTASVLVDAAPTKIRQGYGLQRTYVLDNGRRVLVDIERNAYDFQSHYLAKAWTDTAGWQVVTSIPPEDDEMTKLPSYVLWDSLHSRRICITAVETLAAKLVRAAATILGCAE